MSKEQNNYVHVGETVACGHCRPDEIFDLMEKYGLECDCKCHQETKLPECDCKMHCKCMNLDKSCPNPHYADCVKRLSTQKEESKNESWQDRLKKMSVWSHIEGAEDLHDFISQEISKAKQEVISLCLEKLKDICNKSKTERGLAQALSNYITTLSDELKGINLTKDKE